MKNVIGLKNRQIFFEIQQFQSKIDGTILFNLYQLKLEFDHLRFNWIISNWCPSLSSDSKSDIMFNLQYQIDQT